MFVYFVAWRQRQRCKVFQGARMVHAVEFEGWFHFHRIIPSSKTSTPARLPSCNSTPPSLISSYKQYLAKQVKQELNLESTPTIDSDSTPKETVPEPPAEPQETSPRPAPAAVPVVIGSSSPAVSSPPKGLLVVENVASKPSAASVCFISFFSHPERAGLVPSPRRQALACLQRKFSRKEKARLAARSWREEIGRHSHHRTDSRGEADFQRVAGCEAVDVVGFGEGLGRKALWFVEDGS